MDFSELKELIRILEDSGLSEIEVEEDGRRIRLQKPQPYATAFPFAAPQTISPNGPPEPALPAQVEEPDETLALPTIDAPMVGTFYSAPTPGEEPFVKVGDSIAEQQIVCIVEAMKLMNEVGSNLTGVVERILVENGDPVEFGQPLFAVRVAD